jgi:hypothetical protein
MSGTPGTIIGTDPVELNDIVERDSVVAQKTILNESSKAKEGELGINASGGSSLPHEFIEKHRAAFDTEANNQGQIGEFFNQGGSHSVGIEPTGYDDEIVKEKVENPKDLSDVRSAATWIDTRYAGLD